jgi:hypothetical protein
MERLEGCRQQECRQLYTSLSVRRFVRYLVLPASRPFRAESRQLLGLDIIIIINPTRTERPKTHCHQKQLALSYNSRL